MSSSGMEGGKENKDRLSSTAGVSSAGMNGI